jgi:histidine kinase
MAKVAELEARHPGLLGRRAARGASSAAEGTLPGSALGGSGLDLLTVTKSSQALSGEVHLRTLVEKLLRIAMENAGSRRAVLLLARERGLFIEAEATVDRADIAVMQSIPVEATESLPRSVINYVEHTEDPLMLGDALATAPYQSDPYVVARRARSILCLPIIAHKHLVGILYLEHDLAPDVFTSDRLHVLTLLSAQAAISIENARLYDTLEQRVEDRTRELNERNDQLAMALRQLHDTHRLLVEKEKLASLGTMNAAIAHEVKNPLNFISNFAELASELGEDLVAEVEQAEQSPSRDSFDKLREMAAALAQFTTKVQEHSKRVARIIDAMRQHSVGHRAVHRPVDLNQLLAEHVGMTVEGLRVREPSLPVRLSTRYDDNIGLVHVAPDELGRVISSLVTNAWQAMATRHRAAPDPVPLLEVSTRDLASHVEVRIRDNGVGIPPESRGRIFSPFFTTKPPGEGTGLGLSLSYNVVVHLHGGGLRFESEPGQGTEFIVTLPRS